MGRLRTEPKVKSFLSDEEYQTYQQVLEDAIDAASENDVYFDLEPHENPAQVRKALMYIAEEEGISVKISRKRGEHSLAFSFKTDNRLGSANRMSADESRRRIMNALKDAGGPLKKSEIIAKTNISSSTWNIRVRELLESGEVTKSGDRRDTTYTYSK
jgi:predicted transcriptional regulator